MRVPVMRGKINSRVLRFEGRTNLLARTQRWDSSSLSLIFVSDQRYDSKVVEEKKKSGRGQRLDLATVHRSYLSDAG